MAAALDNKADDESKDDAAVSGEGNESFANCSVPDADVVPSEVDTSVASNQLSSQIAGGDSEAAATGATEGTLMGCTPPAEQPTAVPESDTPLTSSAADAASTTNPQSTDVAEAQGAADGIEASTVHVDVESAA
eukprot:2093525-Pleurochrysis_carterae.AAC.1